MEENKLHSSLKFNRLLAIFLSLLIVTGNLISFGFRYMGIEITTYNVGIPIIAMLYFVLRIKNWREVGKIYNRRYWLFVLTLVGMMIWGVYLFYSGEYVDWMRGKYELLMLGLGFLTVLIIYEIAFIKGGLATMTDGIRMVVGVLTVIAMFEMATGWHMIYSRFSDPNVIAYYAEAFKKMGLDASVLYRTTTLFYNENNFSAFLGLFAPLFFPHRSFPKWKNRIMALELALILIIFSQNDAWICFFSTLVGTVVYLIITKERVYTWIGTTVGIVVVKMFGVQAFAGVVYIIYAVIPGVAVPKGIVYMFFHGGTKLTNSIVSQWSKAESGTGSLYTRIETYGQCIIRTFTDTKGQGFGPGSYTNFAYSVGENKILLNPHSMWIEIFTQYGGIFTVLFMAILLTLYVRLFINYKKTRRIEYAAVIAIDSIFVLICFAPSTYFAVEYMWIPIGLSLALSNIILYYDNRYCINSK